MHGTWRRPPLFARSNICFRHAFVVQLALHETSLGLATPSHGDQLIAVEVEEAGRRRIYVPVRPITEYLGLDWSAQYRRINRDPILSEEIKGVAITATPSPSGVGGGPQVTLCLPAEFLHGWLFGITVSRVKEELQAKVLRYQRECYQVLWEAFQQRATQETLSSTTLSGPLAQVRGLALAIATLAEEQMALERRVGETEDRAAAAHARLDRAAEVVTALHRRLSTVEQHLAPAARITEEQAAEVSSAVKALAKLKGGNYQEVFGELYRRFGVTSYKNIRQAHYEAVLDFLDEWRTRGE